jgi:hypothetical protein
MDDPTFKAIQILLQRIHVSNSESPLRTLAELVTAVEKGTKRESAPTPSPATSEREIPIIFDSHICDCSNDSYDSKESEREKLVSAILERNRKLTLIVTEIFDLTPLYANKIISVLSMRPIGYPLSITYDDMYSILTTICPELSDTKLMNLASAFAACL